MSSYVRLPKCPHCGSKTRHKLKSERKVDPKYYPVGRQDASETCNCSGYHFPHRKGSKHCDHHPYGEYHQMKRGGITSLEDFAFVACPPQEQTEDCPF